jgi:hypothetical protein
MAIRSLAGEGIAPLRERDWRADAEGADLKGTSLEGCGLTKKITGACGARRDGNPLAGHGAVKQYNQDGNQTAECKGVKSLRGKNKVLGEATDAKTDIFAKI